MRTALAGAAALLIASAPAAIAAQDQPAEAPATEEPAKPEKKICRTDRSTGSLTRRTRICLTRAQWNELHSRTRRGMDDFYRGASGGCRAPDNPSVGAMCGG